MTATSQQTSTVPAGSREGRPVWRELPFLIVLAIVLALLVKTLLLQAFSIPSESMQHTLEVGDRVLVNKVVLHVRNVHRGEVVVFNGIDDWAPEGDVSPPRGVVQKSVRTVGNALGVTSAGQKDYIKRVIGVPGDRVMCCSPAGHVVVTPRGGKPVELIEPYLLDASDEADPLKHFCQAGRSAAACPAGSAGVLVPAGRLWVMGDHRGFSADSRSHLDDSHSGTIPVDRVVGRAFVVVYPVTRWGVLGVPKAFLAGAALPAAPYALGLAGALPVTLLRRSVRGSVRRRTRDCLAVG